jgi:uncharacterized membrane protein
MRKTTLLLLLAIGLGRCTESPKTEALGLQSQTPNAAVPATLRGYFVLGPEVSTLRNCTDNKQYWVKDATRSLDSLYKQACFPAPIPYEATYAVLTGTIGPKDTSIAAVETAGTFTVTKVDTLQSKNRFNACLAWEFWCHGTEPFWGIQISEAEGGIFFKNMADETGTQYAWDEPQTDGATSWVYETNDAPGSKNHLKIAIKKENCSDGMSDIEYEYSATVTRGKETLRGCAVRGGEPAKRE